MKTKLLKIVVFVPETHVDAIRKAVGDAGADFNKVKSKFLEFYNS